MDYARRPYDTRVRFFKDNDTETTLRYYPALLNAPNLPFPTAFVNQVWDKEPWSIEGVGEQWLKPTPYNGENAKPSALGHHYCGTPEQFLEGLSFPSSSPNVEYNADGLPTCCGPPWSVGGLTWGGTAIPSLRTTYTTYYGISYSGTAIVHDGPSPAIGSGGISYGGTALVSVVNLLLSSGGISYGGTAGVTVTHSIMTEGGISYGGTAEVNVPITPGDSCATATDVTLPFAYTGNIEPSGTPNWFTFVATSTGTHHIRTKVNSGDGILNTEMYSGSCGGLTPIGSVSSNPGDDWVCAEVSLTDTDQYWVQVIQPFASGTENYSIEIDEGTCPP